VLDPAPSALQKVVRTGTVTTAGDSITASCPAGMKAVSGGVSIPELDVLFVQSFRRAGRGGWTASFYTEGRPTPGVKVSALCDDDPARIREVTKTRSIPGNGRRSVTARCRRSQRVVSGGWDGELSFATPRLVSAFGSIRTGRRAWTSAAENVLSNAGSFTAFAYCMHG